ncbi:MAG: antitoxin family protein [Chloroherpetonaceae bacterium]|nr:antitoxin family protein [Chloroherpetonaceae bacterium]MDW8019451.1 antitoxin family protein [Chloroherpetonaceae bacterium]
MSIVSFIYECCVSQNRVLVLLFRHANAFTEMTMTIEAIYDGETFKPKLPVDLPPNAKAKLTIELLIDDPDEQKKQEERRTAFLEAARKAQGIWANRPDIDEAYQQLEEAWQKWNEELWSLSIRPS